MRVYSALAAKQLCKHGILIRKVCDEKQKHSYEHPTQVKISSDIYIYVILMVWNKNNGLKRIEETNKNMKTFVVYLKFYFKICFVSLKFIVYSSFLEISLCLISINLSVYTYINYFLID